MDANQQRAELQRRIWQIANDGPACGSGSLLLQAKKHFKK
jgi:hypothetical protein